MGNVIQFSSVREQRRSELPDPAIRANRIRVAAQRKDRLSVDDCKLVAGKLHGLMEELSRTHGLKKLDVVRSAGFGGNHATDSTKRLDTYTLPPDANQGRKDRLTKTVGGYIKLAEAIASEARMNPNEVLCRVFEGCDYGTEAGRSVDWEENRWAGLANLLRDMCKNVTRKAGVETYWRDVQMRPGNYDVREDAFLPSPERLWPVPSRPDFSPGLVGYIGNSDESPPIPSVLIARACPNQPAKGTISISEEAWEEIDYFHILEIRLAIGPVTSKLDIGPILEFRTVLEAENEKHGRITFDNPFTDGSDVVKIGNCGGKERPVSLVPDEIPDAPFRDGYEHSYFRWMELSSGMLRTILTGEADGMKDYEVIGANYNSDLSFREMGPSRFAWDEPAFLLHTAVTSGRLEEALIARCGTLKEKLHTYDEHLNATVDAVEAEARNRWRDRQPPNGQTSNSESK